MGLFKKKTEETPAKKTIVAEQPKKNAAPQKPNHSILRSSKASQEGEKDAQKAIEAAVAAAQESKREVAGLDKSKSILEESAIFFANGDYKKAITKLINHLNETKGMADKRAWYMLLDAYQVTRQQKPFEQLSVYFSNRFESSPPSWNEHAFEVTHGNALGRNAISIEGIPALVHYDKIKDFLLMSKEAGNSRIDLSRTQISEEDETIIEGIEKIYFVLNEIRKLKIPVQLMGDAHLIEKLSNIIAQSELDPEKEHQIFWKVLLEIYQWRALEEEFEDLAIRFAMAYEESPPSYSANDVVTQDIVEHVEDQFRTPDGKILPEVIIDQRNIDKLIKQIEIVLKEEGKVTLDFTNVHRMDFNSSTSLAAFLGNLGIDKQRIVLNGATELIILLSEITGVSAFVTFISRKK